MSQQGLATYVNVTNALRAMVVAEPWESDGILPPEPVLMARFQVSRGTVRRATEELAREGLLLVERGRGTTIRRQAQLRALVRDHLAAIAVPDSRWHLDVLRFVPDFNGSDLAQKRISEHPSFAAASTVFIAPDNSLTALIESALDSGKRVVVPTYGMRRGMVLLDPAEVGAADRPFASTLDGLERFGRNLDVAGLRSLGSVDVLVSGGLAFTTHGIHVGSGTAYLDLEWGVLATLGLVGSTTPILGLAHEAQVLDIPLSAKTLDVTVDAVATPDRLVECAPVRERPTGIHWHKLSSWQLDEIAYLRELAPDLEWIL